MSTRHRVLLHVATPKDAAMASAVLGRSEVATFACASLEQLIAELALGAGALMLAEEVVGETARDRLALALHGQPAWSDVPVIVMARQGAASRAIVQMMDRFPNLTVIERPVRVASMISTVRSTLRARRRQYEVRDLLQGLQQADQRKTEFLATLAHELRNPLAPLRTALALLSHLDPKPEAVRYHALMQRQVDHLVRLVDDLMEVSRITRGRIDLQLEPLSLQDAIGGAVELSRPLLESAGHTLTVHLADLPLSVRGDRVRLNQVFSNLLNNAARYARPGGHVDVHAGRAGDDVLISVTDTGDGLSPDMLTSVFDLFVQVSDSAKSAQGGLGIGLTLVKTLVELHGGRVSASSPGLGCGSTFTVQLPLLRNADVQVAGAPPAAAWRQTLTGCSVLVVDDNRDAADSLAELLRIEGADVLTAHGGHEALDIAAGRSFDVAVLDIGMPVMDGCELARRLRSQLPPNRLPLLIALTGWGQHDDQRRIADAGFDHHLLKPVATETLIALMTDRQAERSSAPSHA